MKLTAPLLALAFALTTFACASTDDAASSDQDIVAPTERHCGGIARLGCADDEVCSYAAEASCGTADQTGVCKKKPQICPALVLPICGCDGKTYNNSCEAEKSGASVAHDGKCAAPAFCPAIVAPVCGADGNTYNNSCEAEKAGTTAAHTGNCGVAPTFCPAVVITVCGADGKTYNNSCEAQKAHTTVAHNGVCEPLDPPPPPHG